VVAVSYAHAQVASVELVYTRPWLYPKQEAAVFDDARIVVIEASTKSGKTVGCIIWLVEQALVGHAGAQFWWIAPIRAQAKIAYRRLKRAMPREYYVANESELTLTLANGAVLAFKSAENPDSLYGDDVEAAVIDEASRTRQEAWYAIRSTITATRGLLRIIGNVKGRKNWAYKLARRAESGGRGLSYHKITALDAVAGGVLHADEIEQARADYPETVFLELFMAEASDDEGNPFGIDNIRRNLRTRTTGEPVVAWGWDVASRVDWTVGVGLDRAGKIARFVRFREKWDATEERIYSVTGATPALIDATGVGAPISERLSSRAQAQYATDVYEPYTFTAPSKQRLLEHLAVALQADECDVLEGVMQLEMEAFEYVYTRTATRYSAPEGMHDDCVCALALAKLKYDAIASSLLSERFAIVSLEKESIWR
jgi:hypothetical protein